MNDKLKKSSIAAIPRTLEECSVFLYAVERIRGEYDFSLDIRVDRLPRHRAAQLIAAYGARADMRGELGECDIMVRWDEGADTTPDRGGESPRVIFGGCDSFLLAERLGSALEPRQ